MFYQLSSIFKLLPVFSRHQGYPHRLSTIVIFRTFVCSSSFCNIPDYSAPSKLPRNCSAEFGSQADQHLYSDCCISSVRNFRTTPSSFRMSSLDSVADVDIDPSGKFKYILIEIEKAGKKKTIVRGYKWAGYHADIYDQVCSQLEPQSFKCECHGGGRIEHDSKEQTLYVYGYSMGFGRAKHEITVEKLKAWYPSYKKITFSNEGY